MIWELLLEVCTQGSNGDVYEGEDYGNCEYERIFMMNVSVLRVIAHRFF